MHFFKIFNLITRRNSCALHQIFYINFTLFWKLYWMNWFLIYQQLTYAHEFVNVTNVDLSFLNLKSPWMQNAEWTWRCIHSNMDFFDMSKYYFMIFECFTSNQKSHQPNFILMLFFKENTFFAVNNYNSKLFANFLI